LQSPSVPELLVRASEAYHLVIQVHHPTESSQSTRMSPVTVPKLLCENTNLFRRWRLSGRRSPFNISPVLEADSLPVQMMGLHSSRFLPAVTREEVIYYDCCFLSRTKAPYRSNFLSQTLRSTRTTRLSEPKQAFPRNLRFGVSRDCWWCQCSVFDLDS
jgi:hypothetical protein